MLISEDGRRSLTARRPAECDEFQIPSPDRACTRLEYQDSIRAAPPGVASRMRTVTLNPPQREAAGPSPPP